ncbi:hypothetical protein LC605_24435, partial [Nostoc sp. CHAB 5836]|uniref:hypothetical protein n=1 Tax=Nostoc sp. CHAB 5836 TaxID=2780404 RepID=UPI001E2C800F
MPEETSYPRVNVVDANGNVINPFDGSGGGGDASAINQQSQIALETAIRDRIGDTPINNVVMPVGGIGLHGWLSAIWKLVSDRTTTIISTLGLESTLQSILAAIPSNTKPVAVNVLSAPSPATIYGAGTQNIDTISILATGATYTGVSRNTSFL